MRTKLYWKERGLMEPFTWVVKSLCDKDEGKPTSHSLIYMVCFSSSSFMTAFSSQALLAVEALRGISHIWFYPKLINGWQSIHATFFFISYDSCSKLASVFNAKTALCLYSWHFLHGVHLFWDSDFSTFHCMDLSVWLDCHLLLLCSR